MEEEFGNHAPGGLGPIMSSKKGALKAGMAKPAPPKKVVAHVQGKAIPRQNQPTPTPKPQAPKVKPVVKPRLSSGTPVSSPSFKPMVSGTARNMSTDEFMSKHNIYLASLEDPLHCPGARIPDGNMQETTTIQTVYHTQVASGSGGQAGCILGNSGQSTNGPFLVPQAGATCTIGAATVAAAVGLMTNPTSTSAAAPFSESPAGTGSTPFAIPSLGTFFDANTQYGRLVSAVVSIRTTSNFQNNQGYFLAGSLPSQFFQQQGNQLTNTTLDDYRNSPGAVTVPINDKTNGLQATYNPFDSRSLSFTDTDLVGSIAPSDPAMFQLNPGMMFVLAVGVPTGQTYLIDIALNYEVIVKTGTINFGARPSLDDPLAMATARNVRSNDEMVSRSTDFDSDGYGENVVNSLSKSPNVMSVSNGIQRSALGTSHAVHVVSKPLGVNRKGNHDSKSISVKTEKPLFESVVDGLISVAKKAAPMLLSML